MNKIRLGQSVREIDPELLNNEQWKLLRVNDNCYASSHGVMIKGHITNIIRLSNGKTLFSLSDKSGVGLGLFESGRVFPADEDMARENMTRLDLILRRLEPKGMSTATAVN